MIAIPDLKGLPWKLWRRQVAAVVRLELRRCFLGKRLIAVYFLVLMPVVLAAFAAIIRIATQHVPNDFRTTQIFAGIFQALILRFTLFFGCVGIFTNIFRGETLEKTLHYYFLSAVRREVVVVGKFLAGLFAACVFYGFCVLSTFVLIYLPHGLDGSLRKFFISGPGFSHIVSYLAITGLACLGYGAVFTLMGLLFKNPVLPALMVLGWESIYFLLPPLLKKISVIHYLQSMLPVTLSEGPFAVLAEPTPPLLAAASLIGLALVVLVIAALRLRRMEIAYATD